MAGPARLQRGPGRHPVGRAHPGRARARPTRRTSTSGSGCSTCWPASRSGSSSTCTRTSGTSSTAARGSPTGRRSGSRRTPWRRRSSRRSRPATGRPRSRRCSTTSGPTGAACSTAGLAAWQVAASAWERQPYLMGYDLLNEPWMGIEWPTCLTTGCPDSYPTELQPAMEPGCARDPGDRPPTTSCGGSRSSSPAASRWTPSSPRCRGERAARALVAQLLPRRVPGAPGRARRRRRELPRVRRRPPGARARPVPTDARGADDERVGRHRQPPGDQDRRRLGGPAPDGLDALGLQVLERPDHGGQRPGAVHRRHRPLLGQAGQGCGSWSAPTPRRWPGRR